MNSFSRRSIPWIFFDLDDTLWNFSDNSKISLHLLYQVSPILRKLFKSLDEFVEIYHANNSLMWDLYSKGEVTTKQLKVERWRRTLATRQFEVLTAVCEELDHNYLDILAKQQEKIEGIENLLAKLMRHYIIAVISNGFSKTQYQKLHYSGLDRYITRTIVSEEIGINKPNPKIFEYAIAETGVSEPFLMVGDNPDTDVVGALKAGWHAIWFNRKDEDFPYSSSDLVKMGINPDRFVGTAHNAQELEAAINRLF